MPAWSILISVLATAGSIVAAYTLVPAISDSAQGIRDYALTDSSPSMTMNQGSSGSSTVSVASMNGFDLATGLGATVSAGGGTWLTATLNPAIVTPSSGGSASSILTVSASPSTPPGSYSIQVSSSGGTRSHNISVSVTVVAANFSIAVPPYPLQIMQASFNTTLVTLTSLGAFTGDVSISATTSFNGLSVSGSPASVHLTQGTAAVATVLILAITAPPGTYPVTVTGTSGAIVHSIQIPVTVLLSAREALSIDAYAFSNSTIVTLYIRNTGVVTTSLVSYYVKDASGDQYAYLGWSGPTIGVNQVVPTTFQIGAGCGSCTLTGTAFTFVAGNTYTVIVVTSRNNQFSFSVTR